jgi:hypothetical protein
MPAQRTAERTVLSPALVAVCLGYFMVILDSTIVNVALRADVSGLQWAVDSYLLVLAAGIAASPVAGGSCATSGCTRRWSRSARGSVSVPASEPRPVVVGVDGAPISVAAVAFASDFTDRHSPLSRHRECAVTAKSRTHA